MKLHHHSSSGFSLVEVALAIGIAGFCLISILGLIPVGLSVAQNTSAQSGAIAIMGAVAADLRNIQTSGTTPYFKFSASDTAGKTLYLDDAGSIQSRSNARFRVEVKTLPQTTGTDVRSATMFKVVITWPAGAPDTASIGRTENILALDRN